VDIRFFDGKFPYRDYPVPCSFLPFVGTLAQQNPADISIMPLQKCSSFDYEEHNTSTIYLILKQALIQK